jgi:hypothetical protein
MLLLMICIIGNKAFSQTTTTFAGITGGLSTSVTAGNLQKALMGFQVTVNNGSRTFVQFDNITVQFGTANLANGTLYRSTTNNYTTGALTAVGNVVATSSSNLQVTGFSETITNATYYYFLAFDIINTSSAGANFFINTGNFATDNSGSNNYSLWNGGGSNTYNYVNLNTGTPTPVRGSYNATDLTANTAAFTPGNANLKVFGFKITTTSNITFSAFKINSNLGTVGNYFTNFKLYSNSSNSFSGATEVAATAGSIGSYINFTGASETVDNTTKYYFLVVDCALSNSPAMPVSPQFNLAANQTTAGLTASSPSANYNTTAFGPIYNVNNASITMAALTGGLSSSPIYGGQSGVAMFGFSVAVAGNTTISQFNINSNNNSLSTYFASGTLYENTTNSYGTGTATPVGTVAFNGSYVNVTGCSSTINNTTKYYFLVLNYTYSGNSASSVAFNFASNQNSNAIIQSSPSVSSYNTFNVTGNNYVLNAPPTASITMSSLTGGLATSNLAYGQTAAVLGFSVKATFSPVISGVTTTLSKFNIATDNNTNTLQTLFGTTGTLYRSAGNSYSAANPGTAVGTVTLNGSTVTVTGLTETFANDQTNNYFLVVNQSYNNYATPDAVRFYINAANAAVNANGTNYSAYGIYTPSYTVKARTVGYTITSANASANGITQGNIYPGQTNVVLFGFGISSDISTTVSGFILNATSGNPSNYFSNASAKLYKSTTNVFSFATATLVSGASFAFNSNVSPAITVTGISQSLNATPVYFFIVADITNNYNTVIAASTTMQFKFQTTQTNAITQSLPASISLGPPVDITGTNFTISPPSVVATGYNSASNGISSSVLYYGQPNIVFFGFKLDVSGVYTINQINIATTNSPGNNYKNGFLYRSSDQYFTHATKVSGATVTFNGTTTITGLSEVLNSTTGTGSYYYFLVGDFTVAPANYNPNGTTQFNFSSGSTSLVNQFNNTVTNLSTTNGQVFNVANTYDYIGGYASGDLTDKRNFKTTVSPQEPASSPVFAGSTIFVRIGATAYTNTPSINANGELGGITFASGAGTPQLTIAAGKTLTLNKGLEVLTGVNATVSGGNVTLPAGSVSGVVGTGILNLSGVATFGNAGAFTISSGGTLKLTGNSIVNNTGTFTLSSDATSSATIAPITGTSAMNGSYDVQRFVKGNNDLNYRGYRLLSSPVSDALQTNFSLAYLKGSGSYLTGTGGVDNGFDTNGGASLYLYRQDATTTFSAVTNIKNADVYQITTADGTTKLPVGNGFFYFYRGNNSAKATALPGNVVLTASGHLNQGSVTVKSWLYPINSTSFADANSLSYTSTSAVKGFNLVGNPYASSINWNTAFDGTNGINVSNVSPVIYIYNPFLKTYATYDASTGISKDGGSNVLASGQGFFVLATNTGAKLTFNESAKISGQPATPLLNAAANTRTIKTMRLKLIKDVAQQEETLLAFDNTFNGDYVSGEDAPYLKGFGNVSFASQSADNKSLAINYLPFPKNSERVPMNVMVTETGNYQLNFSQQVNIPDAYDIWLKDTYLKDSLDIRHNDDYKFVVSADTNSKGANRFSVIIRLNPNKVARLLNFSATKSTNDVKINWTAENEASYTTYVLERSTDAGKTFRILDSVTSVGLGTYNDLDPSPILGDNYYRLKQRDVAGNVSYSNIIKVMYAKGVTNTVMANSNISVYPNPARSSLNLAIANNNAKTSGTAYKINITNSSGLSVKSETSTSADWHGQIDNLLPGTYFIQVINTKDNTLTGRSTFIKL